MEQEYTSTAFVSCSLREEDYGFVKYVCSILKKHRIKPAGTVGMLSASPENTAESMRKNLAEADIIVICATPRYVQKDVSSGKTQYGLSEMLHVEAGMAYAHNKPVVVFVKEGTSVGNFLPNITQYIILDGQKDDYLNKKNLITSLLDSANKIAVKIRSDKNLQTAGKVVVAGLAVYGGYKLIQALFPEKKKKRKGKK